MRNLIYLGRVSFCGAVTPYGETSMEIECQMSDVRCPLWLRRCVLRARILNYNYLFYILLYIMYLRGVRECDCLCAAGAH